MKILHTLLLLIFCISGYAQKIGNVSMDLLKQTSHPFDSTAHAAYTKQTAKVSYVFSPSGRFNLQIEYYYQIKIYDDQGEKYADFSLPYYESMQDEKIINIKAYTTNLENGKAIKTQLNKKDIYKEETSEKWRAKKFAMPKVKAGSVIELKYTLMSPFVYAIPKWYFQHYIPTDYSEFKLQVPSYFSLTPVPSGSTPVDNEEDTVFAGDEQVRQYTLTAKDVKAIKEDKFVLNEDDYRGGIKFELNSVEFPGQPIQYYSKDWNEIANNLTERDYGKALYKNFKELKPVVEEAKALPEEERLPFLYTYVQQNFVWNKRFRMQLNEGLKNAVESKRGSSAEINLILINLLQKAGIDAHPLVMKSRGKGLLNTYFPSVTELNYLVAYIKNGEESIIADATSKFVPLGQLPNRAVNIYGILIKDKKGEIVSLDNPNLYKVQTMYKVEVDLENNSLIGDAQQRRSEYAATRYRLDKLLEDKDSSNEDEDEGEDEDDEDMESVDLKNTFKVTETKNLDDINKSITVKSEAEIVTATKIIADKIFIDATIDFGLEENPFTEVEREFPVFYSFRVDRKHIASIKIPEGYSLESKPEDIQVALPESKGLFTYEVKTQSDKLMIYHTLKINNDILLPSDYPSLKEFYNIMFRLTKEKIVLAKK